MAKIKVGQNEGTVVLTLAGERRLDYRVTDGAITVKDEDVAQVLRLTGGELVDGNAPAAATAPDVTEPALAKGTGTK